jgi:hypothetical protein
MRDGYRQMVGVTQWLCHRSVNSNQGAPKAGPMPPLMRGLRKRSIQDVEAALMAEPEIAKFPFWDHEVEPPLCYAIRHKCSAAIVEMLLKHGADPDCMDSQRRFPADILVSMRPADFSTISDFAAIAELLAVEVAEDAPGRLENRHSLDHGHALDPFSDIFNLSWEAFPHLIDQWPLQDTIFMDPVRVRQWTYHGA